MMNAGSVRVTTPSDTEIAMARDFDAPRHLVFAAWTKPELLRRWYGARGWNLEGRAAEGYERLDEVLAGI